MGASKFYLVKILERNEKLTVKSRPTNEVKPSPIWEAPKNPNK